MTLHAEIAKQLMVAIIEAGRLKEDAVRAFSADIGKAFRDLHETVGKVSGSREPGMQEAAKDLVIAMVRAKHVGARDEPAVAASEVSDAYQVVLDTITLKSA